MFDHFSLTVRESALVDHRAPGAGQLVKVKADGKFILGVGLQISHQEARLTPAEERRNRGLKGQFTQNILHFLVQRRESIIKIGSLRLAEVDHSNKMHSIAFDANVLLNK